MVLFWHSFNFGKLHRGHFFKNAFTFLLVLFLASIIGVFRLRDDPNRRRRCQGKEGGKRKFTFDSFIKLKEKCGFQFEEEKFQIMKNYREKGRNNNIASLEREIFLSENQRKIKKEGNRTWAFRFSMEQLKKVEKKERKKIYFIFSSKNLWNQLCGGWHWHLSFCFCFDPFRRYDFRILIIPSLPSFTDELVPNFEWGYPCACNNSCFKGHLIRSFVKSGFAFA